MSEPQRYGPYGEFVLYEDYKKCQKRAWDEGRQAAFIAAYDHKGCIAAAAWPDDEKEGYQNGQIDIQECISEAIRLLPNPYDKETGA